MKVQFLIGEFAYGKYSIMAKLNYTKMKKVKLQHPIYKWWVERKYELKNTERTILFTKLTESDLEAVKVSGMLDYLEVNDYSDLKKLRRQIRRLIK